MDDSVALELVQFVEKPDAETAQAFLDAGGYFWNSGMFLMPATMWLVELERSRPDIAAACAAAMGDAQRTAPFVRPSMASIGPPAPASPLTTR